VNDSAATTPDTGSTQEAVRAAVPASRAAVPASRFEERHIPADRFAILAEVAGGTVDPVDRRIGARVGACAFGGTARGAGLGERCEQDRLVAAHVLARSTHDVEALGLELFADEVVLPFSLPVDPGDLLYVSGCEAGPVAGQEYLVDCLRVDETEQAFVLW
jgi:hypothetical protein